MKKLLVLLLMLSVALYSCKNDDSPIPTPDLEDLPKDTGGDHKAHPLNSDASPYGYYLYTPGGYSPTGPKYPLLIFLHGLGEIGNSSTTPANLDKVLANGPPRLIKAKQWVPKFPMIVASLQCHDADWNAAKVKSATEFLMKSYAVDTTRVYMTGLSMGSFGTWNQICLYGKGSHLAAVIPISGGSTSTPSRVAKAATIPIWAFHGENDGTVHVNNDIQMYEAINALKPDVKMKLTVYPGVDHDAWTRTYNNAAKGSTIKAGYDAFDMDIYEWLFQYKKK